VRRGGDLGSRFDQLFRTPEGEHALISVSGCPVGYMWGQTVDRIELVAVGLSEIPDGAVDIDLFVGESSWLGCGVGSAALRLLLKWLRRQGKALLAGMCVSINNAGQSGHPRRQVFTNSGSAMIPPTGAVGSLERT